MLNDFETYNVHVESAEIEKWSILNTKIDYVEYIRKELPSNRVKFSPTEGKSQKKGIGNYKVKFRHVRRLNLIA